MLSARESLQKNEPGKVLPAEFVPDSVLLFPVFVTLAHSFGLFLPTLQQFGNSIKHSIGR
jgi:hypothetical protein